jgi:nucleoside-diphosphate-sugar epimerase
MQSNKNVLILGVNGFIGSALSQAILNHTNWHIYGMDLDDHKLNECKGHERFHFTTGDVTAHDEWIDSHVSKCDVILPLVAIANPNLYVQNPLRVFELDFESNLSVVRTCAKYGKRVIFPSTSEVYGMCSDVEFDEHTSNLVLGPIDKQRWIYSCSKQMLDRVIYAYGVRDGLDYTLFRPFNWLGPKLDSLVKGDTGSARVVTQMISDIVYRQSIQLVDGGQQRRSFTDIDDGVAALLKIIENKDGKASKQIFNIGNPDNDMSIKELAFMILDVMKQDDYYKTIADKVVVTDVIAREHYGQYYQDVQRRIPKISHIKEALNWSPVTSTKDALKKILAYHLPDIQNDFS